MSGHSQMMCSFIAFGENTGKNTKKSEVNHNQSQECSATKSQNAYCIHHVMCDSVR